MYSKQEASLLRQEFWTTFGKYMSPILSAEGIKVNWINYKTGEKNIYFKMDAGNSSASISIQLTNSVRDIRQLYFQQFTDLKKILHETLAEEWNWQQKFVDESGVENSRIFKELNDVSVFNKADWPGLISFFKPRIIGLDEFWSSAKYGFEALR